MTKSEDIRLGKRIKEFRKQRGWALRGLAKRCGLSANAISLIERGENSPTVSSLRRLAEAFNVPVSDFFQEDHSKTCTCVRNGSGMRIQNKDVELESLGFGLEHQQLEPFRMIIDPHTETFCEPITHPGQEFVYCLSGQVEYTVGEETYHLDPGDCLLFSAMAEHSWRNKNPEPATILLVFQATQDPHLARQRHLEINP
ncbi:MAG: XRE family transcriptional regulator [Anaerolineales bacterium]